MYYEVKYDWYYQIRVEYESITLHSCKRQCANTLLRRGRNLSLFGSIQCCYVQCLRVVPTHHSTGNKACLGHHTQKIDLHLLRLRSWNINFQTFILCLPLRTHEIFQILMEKRRYVKYTLWMSVKIFLLDTNYHRHHIQIHPYRTLAQFR